MEKINSKSTNDPTKKKLLYLYLHYIGNQINDLDPQKL